MLWSLRRDRSCRNKRTEPYSCQHWLNEFTSGRLAPRQSSSGHELRTFCTLSCSSILACGWTPLDRWQLRTFGTPSCSRLVCACIVLTVLPSPSAPVNDVVNGEREVTGSSLTASLIAGSLGRRRMCPSLQCLQSGSQHDEQCKSF